MNVEENSCDFLLTSNNKFGLQNVTLSNPASNQSIHGSLWQLIAVACLLCTSVLSLAQTPDRLRENKKQEKYYFLQKGDVVLFLGNSISQGAKDEVKFLKADIRKRYPELLEGPDSVTFILAGKGGEQAFEGLKRLPELIETHKPTICVVQYGTCEITFDNPDSLVPNLKEIIGMLRKADVRITLVSNPPVILATYKGKKGPRFAEWLPVMAQKSKEVATEESLPFADSFNTLWNYYQETDVPLAWDGIHLNQLGYRLMADALQQAWGYGKPLAPAKIKRDKYPQ